MAIQSSTEEYSSALKRTVPLAATLIVAALVISLVSLLPNMFKTSQVNGSVENTTELVKEDATDEMAHTEEGAAKGKTEFSQKRLVEISSAEAVTETINNSEYVEGTTDSGISYKGSNTIVNSEALAELEGVLKECRDKGVTVSIVERDLKGDSELTYQPDARIYSASAIKEPYCLFVYQDLIESGKISESKVSSTIAKVINYSDNDAYRSIRSRTVGMGWSDWLVDAGVEMDDSRANYFDYHWYVDMSADDFAACWTKAYYYLTSETEPAHDLAVLFESTVHSAIHDVLQQRYKVWSKAGWFDTIADEASYATNDAGIVFSDTGPYVIAVLTDANCDFELLNRLVDACNRCHGELSGGESESLLATATSEDAS